MEPQPRSNCFNKSNAIVGMPSLLGQNGVLTFSSNWPQSKNLPVPQNIKVEEISSQYPFQSIIDVMKQSDKVECNGQMQSRKQNKCGHTQKKHYAKNLCMSCYFRVGRQKKATKCNHVDKPMHAKGLCSKCYQKQIKLCGKDTVS